MNTVFTGFLNGLDYPYAIIDTGTAISGYSEGIDFLDTMVDSLVVTTTTKNSNGHQYIGQNYEAEIPNPWVFINGNPKMKVAVLNTFGLIFYPNGKLDSVAYFEPNGKNPLFYQSSNVRVQHWTPNSGVITIDTNPNADNSTQTVVCDVRTYQDGMVRVVSSYKAYSASPAYKIVFQADQYGNVFFFVDRPDASPVVDRVAHNSTQLNYVGQLQSNVVYCLRASVATATGTIYNASGGVAPNCSVMAFNRVTGRLVGKSRSDAGGVYSILCAAKKGESLFMVCLDDDGVAPDFNAQIIDRIIV